MSTTLPATRIPVVINSAAPSSLYDTIYMPEDNVTVANMTGATVLFFLRPLSSRVPVLNGNAAVPLAPPDLDNNNVRYDPSSGDITTGGEGEFFGWWRFTLQGGVPQETMEFPILISDHGPGLGTQTGAIVDGAQMYMPVTFTALQKDARFGDRAMQQKAELVKWKVLGYTMAPDTEYQLEIVLLDFLSKRVALDLITPGIDFWSRQLRTATSSQTQEVSSFPDMIASLKELRGSLARSLCEDWRQVQLLMPTVPIRTVVPMPASSIGGYNDPWGGRRVTKNPQEMPRLHTGWFYEGLGLFPFP